MRGLSPVAVSGGHSSSRCSGLSLSWPFVAEHGSRRTGSVVVAHRPSSSAACGIFPDQGSNPCPLHRQADSQPLRHQGSPTFLILLDLCSYDFRRPLLFIGRARTNVLLSILNLVIHSHNCYASV